MSRLATALGAAMLATALLASTPAPAQAQPYEPPANTLEVSAYGGYDLPTLDLADAADAGPMFGATVAYRVHEQVTVHLDGSGSFYQSATYPGGVQGPDISVYRATAGIEVNLFDPKLTEWRFLVNGGAGWSFLSTSSLPQTGGVSDDGPSVRVGAKIAYPVSDKLLVYLGGDGYFDVITGGQDLRPLQQLNLNELQNWNASWSVPFTLGVRFSLN